MTFHLFPAQESDIPDLVTIFHLAFADDPITGKLRRKVPMDIRRAEDSALFSTYFGAKNICGARVFKAVETETGKIVGFSQWNYPHRLTDAQVAVIKAERLKDGPFPEGTDVPLAREFYEQMWKRQVKWMEREKCYFLHILATLPTYHRRGIGTLLLNTGIAAADAANAQIYLEASPMALPLYLRHGWKPVDEIRIDLEKYGYLGEGVGVDSCLIREPKGGGVLGE